MNMGSYIFRVGLFQGTLVDSHLLRDGLRPSTMADIPILRIGLVTGTLAGSHLVRVGLPVGTLADTSIAPITKALSLVWALAAVSRTDPSHSMIPTRFARAHFRSRGLVPLGAATMAGLGVGVARVDGLAAVLAQLQLLRTA